MQGICGEYIFETIRKNGAFYEHETLVQWEPLIRDKKVVFDIGANLGNHTVYFSKTMPDAKIFAFEPIRQNFELLEANCNINQCTNVKALNIALGDQRFDAYMTKTPNNMGASHISEEGTEPVLCERADALGLPDPNFVKIDTEGYECQVLQGMRDILVRAKPLLWVETSSDQYGKVLALLKPLGYNLIDVVNMNLLFSTNDVPAIWEMGARYLQLVEKYWDNNARNRQLMKDIIELKSNLDVTKHSLSLSNEKRAQLINDMELLRSKHGQLISDLNAAKQSIEQSNERKVQLIHDMEILRSRNEQLLSDLKLAKQSLVQKQRKDGAVDK